jgi:hypothetical protein
MGKVIYKWFSSKRTFGVEMEVGNNVDRMTIRQCIQKISKKDIIVAGWDLSNNNSFWHVKTDSTCGPSAHLQKDYGVEIASFTASGYKDLKHITEVAAELGKSGVQVNNNCGLHVHVGVSDFTPAQMGILFAHWVRIEPIICCLVADRRLKNKHCRLWHTRKGIDKFRAYSPQGLWDMIAPTNFSPHNNRQKKVSLNFVNFAAAVSGGYSRMTVELRLPEGTLSPRDISAWVRIFVSFVDTCAKSKMPINLMPIETIEEFLQSIGLAERERFTFLSEGYLDTKSWIMEKILASSYASRKPWGRSLQRQVRTLRERLILKVA